jgi:sugar/nucleoside kinase (ribokinase family)
VFGVSGSPEATLEALSRYAPKATIALLQGKNGSTVLDNGRFWTPTVDHVVEVIDPIGAGDAYAAGYLWSTLRGRTTGDAIDAAATVAALKCSIWGDIALITERDVADASRAGPDVRR